MHHIQSKKILILKGKLKKDYRKIKVILLIKFK